MVELNNIESYQGIQLLLGILVEQIGWQFRLELALICIPKTGLRLNPNYRYMNHWLILCKTKISNDQKKKFEARHVFIKIYYSLYTYGNSAKNKRVTLCASAS